MPTHPRSRLLPTLLVASFAALPPVAAAGPGTLMVGTEDRAAVRRLEAEVAAFGGVVRRCAFDDRLCLVDFPGPRSPDELLALAGVRWVERDARTSGPVLQVASDRTGRDSGPLAPYDFPDAAGTGGCPDLWELALVGAPAAWELVAGERAPVVAIQDSGFLATHVDLAGRVAGQHDYGDRDPVAEVVHAVAVPGHGTFIAGLIVANGANGVGRVGLAPLGLLFLQKIADGSGALWISYAVDAMADLVEHHPEVRVLSYSLTASHSTAMEEAVAALGEAGVLVVAAAGNCPFGPSCSDADNDRFPLYPASFGGEHVVAVASTDRADEWNPWSRYGRDSVDLAAPGVDLCSLGIPSTSSSVVASGTSYATPLVAAGAALLLEAHPDLTAPEVARVLRASARPLAVLAARVRSGGRLDVEAALATGVPRLSQPEDVVVEGRADATLVLGNVGAPGLATALIHHGAEVEVLAGDGWEREPFAPGSVLELPDAGTLVATGSGTRLARSVDAHATARIPLVLVGRSLGRTDATVRAAIASSGAHAVGSPSGGDAIDPTGFPALRFAVTVTALDEGSEDAGADGGPDDAGEDAVWPDAGPDGDRPYDGGEGDGEHGDREGGSRGCRCEAGGAPLSTVASRRLVRALGGFAVGAADGWAGLARAVLGRPRRL